MTKRIAVRDESEMIHLTSDEILYITEFTFIWILIIVDVIILQYIDIY